jgi:hypothetical protein
VLDAQKMAAGHAGLAGELLDRHAARFPQFPNPGA